MLRRVSPSKPAVAGWNPVVPINPRRAGLALGRTGRILIFGSIGEGVLLLVASATGIATLRAASFAYVVLPAVGITSVVITFLLGRLLLREVPRPAAVGPAETRALWARGVGIASVVLVYPLGVVLGPLSLWLGRSAIRRVNRGEAPPSDIGPAAAGAVIGALVCGAYLFWALAEVVAILLFGSPIPAA
jgi:hypothetical protein